MEPKVRCPRDGDEMEGRQLGGKLLGFRIDECPKCKGTWFDRGELRKVTKDREIERLLRDYASPAPTPIRCARDASPMKRRVLADVQVEVCGKCGGIWLDGGELDDLVEAAREIEEPEDVPRPLSADLQPRDIAILARFAPDTLQRLQHETRPSRFR